jgi:hypothetical protein
VGNSRRRTEGRLTALSSDHYEEVLGLRQGTNEFFHDAVMRGVEDGSFARVGSTPPIRRISSVTSTPISR